MAPMIVILVSPALLGERVSRRKLLCVAAAFAGFALTFALIAVFDRKAAKKKPDIVIVNRL